MKDNGIILFMGMLFGSLSVMLIMFPFIALASAFTSMLCLIFSRVDIFKGYKFTAYILSISGFVLFFAVSTKHLIL